MQWTSPRS
ncbi:unnamed protein product [Cyprideis torosa]|uniref:Uncharacterized protein n=1 Tax=Cyprideis torosa TaxID=163714 RepID=A0A7R8ZYH1_9CRUS|nr:unnamed protein product [Cyprideis torosa]CAG0908368.1 unnamed protein product [Cyprideis torosa]